MLTRAEPVAFKFTAVVGVPVDVDEATVQLTGALAKLVAQDEPRRRLESATANRG